MKLTKSLRSSLYWFIEAYSKGLVGDKRWDLTNESFEDGRLHWESYQHAIVDPYVMKLAITVWSNNLEVDETGRVLNEEWARFRAFQAIRHNFDKNFSRADIAPPLETWEVLENELGEG
jgi:hypothetical protein